MSFVLTLAFLAVSAPGNAVVINPVINMYSRATEDADVVSQAIYGSTVGIVEDEGPWAKVRTPDQYTGWVRGSALRRLASGERPYASSGRVAQVESLFANLYRQPSVTKHQPLLTVPFETKLEVIAEPENEAQWLRVRLPDDGSGWVQRGDVTLNPENSSVAETISLSKRFLGLPYFWGGTSSFGYDCSGFTQMLCRRRGVLMPRDAGPQAQWEGVVPVEQSDLQPGDLLFFGKSAASITHTGMYIGNGEFIHATTHIRPVVQIGKLDDPHWTQLLVAARRLK